MARVLKKDTKENLERLYDFLGEYGGKIETNDPETWWTLSMIAYPSQKTGTVSMVVGIYSDPNGVHIADPEFCLDVKFKDGKISKVEVVNYTSQTVTGTLEIDRFDNAICNTVFGNSKEKDPVGIVKRFDEFMHSMCVAGPYLTEPKLVSRYDKAAIDAECINWLKEVI